MLRTIAAGCVAPLIEHNEARWRATVVPKEADVALFQTLVDLWMRTTSSTVLARAQMVKRKFYSPDDEFLTALRAPIAQLQFENGALPTEIGI
jgi:hypothetical protein